MKKNIISAVLLFSCLALILASGCSKKEVEADGISTTMKPEGHLIGTTQQQGEVQPEGVSAGDLESLDQTGINPLAGDTTSDEYRAMYGRSTAPLYPVYFDFDSSAINMDQLDNLNSSGSHLMEDSAIQLVVEGNCDARGTADYNLALGELRAINVKKYLVNIGVANDRITTISYGSQRPLYHGSDEDSWAANRRADLVILP